MPTVLDLDGQQARVGVMVSCPHIFGHVVYITVVTLSIFLHYMYLVKQNKKTLFSDTERKYEIR